MNSKIPNLDKPIHLSKNSLNAQNGKKNNDKMISETTKITGISLFSSTIASIAGISQGYPIDTIKTRI
jgi:hypothetical protein